MLQAPATQARHTSVLNACALPVTIQHHICEMRETLGAKRSKTAMRYETVGVTERVKFYLHILWQSLEHFTYEAGDLSTLTKFVTPLWSPAKCAQVLEATLWHLCAVHVVCKVGHFGSLRTASARRLALHSSVSINLHV